jgi:ATP-dependent Lon protease
MDRLEPILMPSYSDEEKIHIARDYILPNQLAKSALPEGTLTIEDSVWPKIARPLGFDAGIRTLERTIEGIVRKVAKMVVEGKIKEVVITEANVKQYLPTY